jgi:hypothetical protein
MARIDPLAPQSVSYSQAKDPTPLYPYSQSNQQQPADIQAAAEMESATGFILQRAVD